VIESEVTYISKKSITVKADNDPWDSEHALFRRIKKDVLEEKMCFPHERIKIFNGPHFRKYSFVRTAAGVPASKCIIERPYVYSTEDIEEPIDEVAWDNRISKMQKKYSDIADILDGHYNPLRYEL
jgi:hypothetical protein